MSGVRGRMINELTPVITRAILFTADHAVSRPSHPTRTYFGHQLDAKGWEAMRAVQIALDCINSDHMRPATRDPMNQRIAEMYLVIAESFRAEKEYKIAQEKAYNGSRLFKKFDTDTGGNVKLHTYAMLMILTIQMMLAQEDMPRKIGSKRHYMEGHHTFLKRAKAACAEVMGVLDHFCDINKSYSKPGGHLKLKTPDPIIGDVSKQILPKIYQMRAEVR